MNVKISNPGKWRSCDRLRLRTGLMAWIAASSLVFWFAASEVRAQAPAVNETAQSAASAGQASGVNDQKNEVEHPVASVSEQQKKLAEDKARLLKLATELKNEIDKAGTVALSAGALRKADEIEKLARSIRQAMNRELGQAH